MSDETDNSVWGQIGKYGIATVFAILLLGMLRYDMVLPANEDRKSTTDALIEANKANTEINRSLTESYQKMSTAVEGQTTILKEIRDDQKKFPAVREASKD